MAVAQGAQIQVPSGFGIAGRHPHDQQIESDPNVIVAADFESDAWRREFSGGNRPTVSVVAEDRERTFQPLLGKALRIKVSRGEHYGASIEYDFKRRLGYEPEEIYFRYYLRFGSDWDPARGGKLPGIGGTYGRGGWGGRPSDGRNGWSARGQFDGQKGGKTPIGFYCYHADMKGRYGSSWIWEKGGLGYLENNRWYCIEQYARLNTPGQNDGTLRGWIDGKLAFERTDVRMRDVPDLKIESIWLNVYHGGTWSASSDDHLFIDNVVVAKQYIGPMARETDIVVYGGTSAGVIAAVQAARMSKSVVLVCPDKHLGGLSSGGLGWTDTGRKEVIGGLARQFYHRIWQHYQRDDAWKWQDRSEYGNRGQGTPAIDGAERTMWIFEPHVAERVFEDLVAEHHIPVHRDEWLDRERGVQKVGGRIHSISMLSGKTFYGKVFIDATYEGDLMASAGVSYHVGRESNSRYGETWNGVQPDARHHGHYFKKPVDPYVTPGDPNSRLLPRISRDPIGTNGQGDDRIQAYCFRMCLTNVPENRVPFRRPDDYDPTQYELLLRVFDTGWRETFAKFDPIPNHKTDTNNHGPFSTDNIGMNYDYPEATYERRRDILAEHETYQKGLMYFIANDPRVPADVQERMRQWGLAKDEFTDNGHWPHQLYIRESRRMIGVYVMTENDVLCKRVVPQPVGMGSYAMDSHNVQRHVTADGLVQNEGDIGVSPPEPYRIAYGALCPKKGECENLLVPVCVSSSHIAYGSIRMEPVFMILGQSAATAAVHAIDAGCAVQDVDDSGLRGQLVADDQRL
jgi:hypothetical protein